MTAAQPTPDMVEGRAQVMHRALNHCEAHTPWCKQWLPPEWHHRQSRRGGIHGPHNGLAACPPCHRYIHAHPREAFDAGWIVPMVTTDPELAPCKVRGQWVTLSKGGTYT